VSQGGTLGRRSSGPLWRRARAQVIEYCDLGNLSNALKNHIFMVANPVMAAAAGAGDAGAAAELAERARTHAPAKVGYTAARARLRGTLIEAPDRVWWM
jgi:hypothetical protein